MSWQKIITGEAENVISQASPQRAVLVLNGLGSDAALALAFHLENHSQDLGPVFFAQNPGTKGTLW